MDDIIELEFIKEAPNYLISNKGIVYSVKTNKIIKPHINEDGYARISLYSNGKKFNRYIHRLIGEAFLEKQNKNEVIDHIGFNRLNNDKNNLRWVNISYNCSRKNYRLNYN